MRKFVFTLLLPVFFGVPSYAEEADLVRDIWRHREFILRLTHRDDRYLFDVRSLDANRVGILLLDSSGYTYRTVFDTTNPETMTVIYEEAGIPKKSVRTAMRDGSILVGDAKRLVRSVNALRGDERR